jgi:hypothetical protein
VFPSFIIFFVLLDFACFDILKRKVPRRLDGSLSPITSFLAGAFSGTVAQTVAYPLDTIRRRLQVQGYFFFLFVLVYVVYFFFFFFFWEQVFMLINFRLNKGIKEFWMLLGK